MDQSDGDLVAACREGSERAWEKLVARYQKLIYAIPRRAGLDEEGSADVFQEVFTTLFESLNKIVQPERLHAWIVTTTKRKTMRLIAQKSLGGRPSHEGDDNEEMNAVHDAAPLADDVMLRVEEQHRVRAALARMNERCRKLLTLLFYEETPLPYATIAHEVGIKEGSIGPTRARCLQKLLLLLET